MRTLLCFGDSNTWGYIPGSNGRRFPRDARWPVRLQRALGDALEVIAEGLNGRTATMDSPVGEGPQRAAVPRPVPALARSGRPPRHLPGHERRRRAIQTAGDRRRALRRPARQGRTVVRVRARRRAARDPRRLPATVRRSSTRVPLRRDVRRAPLRTARPRRSGVLRGDRRRRRAPRRGGACGGRRLRSRSACAVFCRDGAPLPRAAAGPALRHGCERPAPARCDRAVPAGRCSRRHPRCGLGAGRAHLGRAQDRARRGAAVPRRHARSS